MEKESSKLKCKGNGAAKYSLRTHKLYVYS